jgi:hypothetical protein
MRFKVPIIVHMLLEKEDGVVKKGMYECMNAKPDPGLCSVQIQENPVLLGLEMG